MNDLAAQIYIWLTNKSRKNPQTRVRSKTLINDICSSIINDPIAIKKALLELKADGKIEYQSMPNGEPLSSFVTVIFKKTKTPDHVVRWDEVLSESSFTPDEKLDLGIFGYCLADVNKYDMTNIAQGLIALRKDQSDLFGQPSFNVSAKYFLGSSKMLANLGSRELRTFGIEIDRFMDRPPYIVVGGNNIDPEAVILVENPTSFETAIQSEASTRFTFVCTFGFGLSNQGSDYGNQLAGAIETGSSIVLWRTHEKKESLTSLVKKTNSTKTIDFHDFNSILGHPELHFWGDLDHAGMQIFERISKNKKATHIKLSALYTSMVTAAGNPKMRHPYIDQVGKSGQKAYTSSRADVIKLLEHCRNWAIDQEVVSVEDIENLAGKTLK
jgi:hypothetical protein